MTKTIYAIDNEFAAATGSNVNALPGQSRFDYPPNGSKDLVITSNSDDDNPFTFELGDTYDITFGGHGGTTLADAVVIRSDIVSGGGGPAVVFEGADPNGDLVQVVWTPDFDLEGWYWSNFSGGTPPVFNTSDMDPQTYQHICFAAGTRIDTPSGPIPVQYLQPGMAVLTQDSGAQEVVWLGKRRFLGVGPAAPVIFEPGALGNHSRLVVSQQHRMLLTDARAELMFGSPEVFVPAKALVNGRDIRIEARRKVGYFHLLLPRHEIVRAEGAAAESLFLGDISLSRMPNTALREVTVFFPELVPGGDGPAMVTARPDLSMWEARLLADQMGITADALPTAPSFLIAA